MPEGSLTLHVGEDLEVLAAQMAPLVAQAPGSVLERPWCVAPSLALTSWLTDALGLASGAEGIAANLETMSPSRLVTLLETALIGDQEGDWSQGALAVKIHALGRAESMRSALRQATELSQLLEWRPELFVEERLGELPSDLGELAAQVGLLDGGPLVRRRRLLNAIAGPELADDLPRALFVFGLSYIPGGRRFLELLGALSASIDLHLFLVVPSLDLAERALGDSDQARSILADPSRFSWLDESLEAVTLLADWIKSPNLDVEVVCHKSRERCSSGVLGRLQDQLVGEHSGAGDDDRSVSLIGSYGASRQVEELRDLLIEKLASDDDLQPHEIAVLCPDLGTYLPLLERHLANPASSPLPNLPFHAAQRPQGQSRRRIDVSLSLLSLIGSHVTADQVADLLGYSSVGATLGLPPESQSALLERAAEGRLLFGASAIQRARFGIYEASEGNGPIPTDVGTWRRTSDRVVSAALYPDVRNVDAEDVADVHPPLEPLGESDDLRSFAALQPLLDILDETARYRKPPKHMGDGGVEARRPLGDWLEELERWMSVVARPNGRDESFESLLEEARRWAGEVDSEILGFDDFVELWRSLVGSGPSSSRFNLGGVVLADAGALAYVPFKVVALLGLDEEHLPAGALTSTLLLSEAREPGDPDPRRSMRGALLAGVLSARQSLVVAWSSRDEIKGQEVSPCIVLSELLDRIAEVVTSIDGSAPLGGSGVALAEHIGRDARRHHHFGEHRRIRYGARLALGAEREWAIPSVDAGASAVASSALSTFLRAPVATYLRQVRNLEIPEDPDVQTLVPPVSQSKLDVTRFGRRVLDSMLAQPLGKELRSVAPGSSLDVYNDLVDRWRRVADGAISDVAREEEFSSVPPKLWLDQLLRGRLANYTFNLAWEFTDLTPLDEAQLRGTLIELEGGSLLFDPVKRREPSALGTYYRSTDAATGMAVISAVNLRTTDSLAKKGSIASTVLGDLATLLILRSMFPDAIPAVDSVFLPTADARTKRANGFLPSGVLPGNARIQLFLDPSVSAAEATGRLGRLVERYRSMFLAPTYPVLFRKTTAAEAFPALGLAARSTWESSFRKPGSRDFSESAEQAHLLTFPEPFEALSGRPDFGEHVRFFAGLADGVRLRWSPSANSPTSELLRTSFSDFEKRYDEHLAKPGKSPWLNPVPLVGAEDNGSEG